MTPFISITPHYLTFQELPWRNTASVGFSVTLRAAQVGPLQSDTFCYCRQHFLSGNTERSSCHCHRLSSALTNTREPLPGLIPLLTEIDVVTCTMSLLLEQRFLFISIFCYRSHVNASKGSCGRMNGLRLCISHLTAFQRHFLGQHAPLFSKCHKKVFKSTG